MWQGWRFFTFKLKFYTFFQQANRDVTRMEIFVSLVHLLEKNAKNVIQPAKGISKEIPWWFSNFIKLPLLLHFIKLEQPVWHRNLGPWYVMSEILLAMTDICSRSVLWSVNGNCWYFFLHKLNGGWMIPRTELHLESDGLANVTSNQMP